MAHDKLVAMGYRGLGAHHSAGGGGGRAAYGAGHRRVYRPWVPEPGMWFQYDFGDGPMVDGDKTMLFCAWLSWSRFRVVLAILDKTLPTVVACIDQSLRRFGGCPTYALTDNEKTVTVEHVARIPIRNPAMVAAARHYGLTVETCVPADPRVQGRFGGHGACGQGRLGAHRRQPAAPSMALGPLWTRPARRSAPRSTGGPHRVTRRAPVEMLAEEQPVCTACPNIPTRPRSG